MQNFVVEGLGIPIFDILTPGNWMLSSLVVVEIDLMGVNSQNFNKGSQTFAGVSYSPYVGRCTVVCLFESRKMRI